MNNKNKNLNADQNGHAGQSDRLEVEQFVESLETETRLVDALNEESRAIASFGADIRESADLDLPKANAKLRELLLVQTQQDLPVSADESDETLQSTVPVKESVRSSSIRWLTPGKMAMAACVLLAATLFILLLPLGDPHFDVAMIQMAPAESALPTQPVEVESLPQSVVDRAKVEGDLKYGRDLGQDGLKKQDAAVADLMKEVDESAEAFDAPAIEKPMKPLRDLGAEPSVNPVKKLDLSRESMDSVQVLNELKADSGNDNHALFTELGSASPFVVPAGKSGARIARRENRIRNELVGKSTSRGGGGVGGGGVGGRGVGGRGAGGGGRGVGGDGRASGDARGYVEYYGIYDDFRDEPGAGSSGERYEPISENRFLLAKGRQALSTFSIDVDTASYSNMRRFLNNRQRPPRNAIRIEELVNYFNYDYPQPQGDTPFSVNMELASCPWNEQHHLLRVGLKGKEIHREERSPSNLVFLLDVSGSMQSGDKLPLLKKGLAMMIQRLSENDTVSIVTYAGNAGVVLEPTNGANKQEIDEAIERLNAGGSTNGSAGINLAYELAQKHFIKGGSNRVILATDGDLNVGVTSNSELVKLIKNKASEGVFLTVLGFGSGNLKDSKLEQMADNGNGMYAYIDNFREAHRVLIEQMSGSLETIAKDVKIQIEFNPSEVVSYRLIGYENRVLAAKDFDNDKKDAGEIGAGHTVTALYELELAGKSSAAMTDTPPLRYQDQGVGESTKSVAATGSERSFAGEILTLSLRYKKPDENESQKIQFSLSDEPKSFSSASSDFQFAAAVASFGMLLRHSEHRGSTSFDWVEATASRAVGDDTGGHRIEFLDLVRKAAMRR